MSRFAEVVARFYGFMLERELIRQRRREGRPMGEWTADPIFQTFSFTNVKRHDDRTTVLFKRIHDEAKLQAEAEGVGDTQFDRARLFNAAVFRFFGTYASARTIGWTHEWSSGARERLMEIGPGLGFTSAYIVTSAGRSDPKYVVVVEFLDDVWKSVDTVLEHTRWEGAIDALKSCYGVGAFMAKEIYLDYLLWSGRVPDDWQTYTPVGPGGRRGASRLRYGVDDKISESESLDVIRDVYAMRDEHWPDTITVEGVVRELPRLDLTDIQFQLCEFDKYSRVAEGRRPKRLFRPKFDDITGGRQ